MHTVNFFDDLGIILLLRPIYTIMNFDMLNLIDDMGIFFVCTPLRYLHRLAEIILRDDEIARPIRTIDSTWHVNHQKLFLAK